MTACLITVASRAQGHYERFLGSCLRQAVKPTVLGWGAEYRGHGLKIKLAHRFLKEQSGQYSHVVFCDSFDLVLAAGLQDILTHFRQFNSPIVFSAERNCYPDAIRQAEYPTTPSPYKHLNSGFWVAETAYALGMLNVLTESLISDEVIDQAVYTDAFLKQLAPMSLDYECRLCQSLHWSERDIEFDAQAGKIRNRITGSFPCVFHGNGSSDMSQVFEWLKL